MAEVGRLYEEDEDVVLEILMPADTKQEGMQILKPELVRQT